jgi:TolB protein
MMRRIRGVAGAFLGLALVAAAAGCGGPAPSPSGPAAPTPRGQIAFSSEGAGGDLDVYVATIAEDRLEAERLTATAAREFDPDLSPDGVWVVFRSNPDVGEDHADLWQVAIDGTGLRNLTSAPGLDNWSPAYSPDGTRIAFASTRDAGVPRIWTMARDGTDLRLVTSGHGEYPDWSPDGSQIVYAAPPQAGTGAYDLWIAAADGSGSPTRLTDTSVTEFGPAWSPDGAWIAYQRDAGSAWELWLVRPDGSDAHRVSPDGEDGVWPAWGPDGLLAWAGTRGLTFLDLASGESGSIAGSPGGTDFLSWGPAPR